VIWPLLSILDLPSSILDLAAGGCPMRLRRDYERPPAVDLMPHIGLKPDGWQVEILGGTAACGSQSAGRWW
jgi:hypothetical protein